MDAGYRLLEHTADAGLVAWGPTPAEAFAQATRGMFAVVLGEDPEAWSGPGTPETRTVEAEGNDWSELLVNWLAELVYHFDVDWFVPRKISFQRCEPSRCAASLEGVRLDDAEQAAGVQIKAITYHQLYVEVEAERTELQVIFDI